MPIHQIKRITESSYLKHQDKKVQRNNGYAWSNTLLVPKRNFTTKHCITDLSKTEQAEFEQDLLLNAGDLAPNSKYWDNFDIELIEGIAILNDNDPLDRLKLRIAKTLDRVAHSQQGIKDLSIAEYVITNPEADATEKLSVHKKRDEAVIKYHNMSEKQIKEFALLTNPFLKIEEMSYDRIQTLVIDYRDQNPSRFLTMLNDKSYKHKVFINQLVNFELVFIQGGTYKDKQTGELLGYDIESTIDFLFNTKNKPLVDAYKQKLSTLTKKEHIDID